MTFATSPSVKKFASYLTRLVPSYIKAETELSVAYQPIMAEGKVRLLELRREWSEIGALYQLRDELCVMWSMYSYLWQFPELTQERLLSSEEPYFYPAVHPRAAELFLKEELFKPWIEMSDAAMHLIPNLAVDQYWSVVEGYQARLQELQEDGKLSELSAFYLLIDELSAEVALMKCRARHKSYQFFPTKLSLCS